MKEQFKPMQIDGESLTTSPVVPTLDVRGKNPMVDSGKPERPIPQEPPIGRDIPPESPRPHEPKSQPDKVLLKKVWERKMGKPMEEMSPDERQTVSLAIESGIPPISGGATALDETKYTDARLTPIVGEVNREFRESEGVYDPKYLTEIRNKVRDLREAGADEAQVGDLIAEINGFLREQRIRERREGGLRRFHGIETITRKYTPQELLTNRKKRDEVFSDIFALVDSNPLEFWDRAFNSLTHGMDLEAFIDIIRIGAAGRFEEYGLTEDDLPEDKRNILKQELKEDLIRYETEREVRKSLHDANALLDQTSINFENVHNYLQGFSGAMGDFAHRLTGVPEMMDLYEAALREDMIKNDGFLRPEAVQRTSITVQKKVDPNDPDSEIEPVTQMVAGEIEVETKRRFREYVEKGKIILRTDKGERIETGPLEDWEVDRIYTIARGMMMMSERIISIAAESKLPKGGVYTSLYLQDILQTYSPYVHLLTKYGVTESGLAAYLYKEKTGKNLLDLLGLWSKDDLERALKMVQSDSAGFLKSTEFRYLLRTNPNMAGDLFTWGVSWRASEEPDAWTMSKRFIQDGGERMVKRKFGISQDMPDEFVGKKLADRITGVTYPENATPEDIYFANVNFLRTRRGLTEVSAEEIKNYLSSKEFNEYGNWIGTAIRFERLRADLYNFESKDPEKREKFEEALDKAKKILLRMAALQPHRLYSVSKEIRERVDKGLSAEQKERVTTILNDLHLVERTLLENRERLLDEGKTFDTVSLSEFFDAIEITETDMPNATPEQRQALTEQRRGDARRFAELVSGDFSANEQKYLDEFIYNREYTHGYVLWSGDAPVNEFNMSGLGPTGAFPRRARDNKAASEAGIEEIKMLMNLRNIRTPEEVVSHLWAIYEKIAMYDAGKAKQAVAEKAEGIIKFFAADMKSQIPVIGNILGKFERVSFAQVVYGKSAPVWQPAEARSFLVKLKDAQMITKEQFDELAEKGFASPIAVSRDIGVTMAQIIAVVMAIYMFQELTKQRHQA